MSGHVQAEFKDYYGILGVVAKASSDEIATAYQTLAKKYHPATSKTGNKAKFEEVTEAYEALANPQVRADYDKIRSGPVEEKPRFTGLEFFRQLAQEAARRSAILCILYDQRRLRPFAPSISQRNMEGLMTLSTEELNFSIWFLKQRSLVQSDDKSSLLITVAGMEWLERNMPEFDHIRPFIKEYAGIPAQIQPK
jgi:curved DNA-binding protein CbpA